MWFDIIKAKTDRQKSLTEWSKEDWQPLGDGKNDRYAPKKVKDALTDNQKGYENRKKDAGTKAGKKNVPRGKSAKKVYERHEGVGKASKKKKGYQPPKGVYTKPAKRKEIKDRLQNSSKYGGKGWNGRKAQALARLYEKAGGGYVNGK
tara:strand:- start:4107 stop:4550 length:444 start_codon:yes stop_codon:yes gene_type:complete